MRLNLVSTVIRFLLLFTSTMTGGPTATAALPTLKDLTPAVRARLDQMAERQPLDTLRQQKLDAAGNVSQWALRHLAMAPEVEREHAEAANKRIREREKAVETPAEALSVLRKLLDHLPPHLKPSAFEYELVVLDRAEADAFTLGGGFVYVSRPFLDAILADRERGESALAFVLAHQLGYIGLEHTRRGWQAFELEEELHKGIEIRVGREPLRDALHTSVEIVGDHVKFLYTRRQIYETDLFAWQLCRNSGIKLESALDALRLQAVQEHPRILTEEAPRPPTDEAERERPPALLRLHRLFMERDGLVDDEENKYGLFIWNPRNDTFQRCENRSLAADEKPIVFVHGFRGSMRTFRNYLQAFAHNPELNQRKLLVFRYPNSSSLGRCGGFLVNEMRRVVSAPKNTVFICHSAGGLVFRWYAETRKQPFARAVMLSTPHEGTSLTSLKYLADLGALFEELKTNGPGALSRMLPEGEGQIIDDVHDDSLFLRYLGHNADLARRYHVFSGDFLRRGQVLAAGVAIAATKRALTNRVLPRFESSVIRRQALRRIERWHLPREIAQGDLVVSVQSALLKDAKRVTRTSLNHEEFMTDEDVIEEVMKSLQEKE